jgi:hypothetical protein
MDFIVELIKLGSVGLVSGLFGAYMALRKYKHEKWWDMRVCAYKECIETFSDLAANYKYSSDNWMDVPQENLNVISKKINDDDKKVRKLRDMGAFLFSKEAEDALTVYVETSIDWDHISDPDDIYGPYAISAKKCLEKLVAISKKDLGVNRRWL